MKTLIHFFLSLAGFGLSAGLIYYVDPTALDVAGFAFFYLGLILGTYNLCLLFFLAPLQAGLLTFLLVSFLLLQQLRLFLFWEGAALVIAVVVLEQYWSRKSAG